MEEMELNILVQLTSDLGIMLLLSSRRPGTKAARLGAGRQLEDCQVE